VVSPLSSDDREDWDKDLLPTAKIRKGASLPEKQMPEVFITLFFFFRRIRGRGFPLLTIGGELHSDFPRPGGHDALSRDTAVMRSPLPGRPPVAPDYETSRAQGHLLKSENFSSRRRDVNDWNGTTPPPSARSRA